MKEVAYLVQIGDKEYYGVIYKITNIVNNKSYIGQTTHKRGFLDRYPHKGIGIERVYKYHKHRKDINEPYNTYLLRAIEKYGFENFIVDEVLDVASSKEELDLKETMYIQQFNSFENGYNMNLGGHGNKGFDGIKGKNHILSRKICQISLDGDLIKIWDCINDIERELGFFATNITRACKGELQVVKGFIWVYAEEYDKTFDYSRTPKSRPKKVVLVDNNNGQIIKEYDNMKAAAKQLKISQYTVADICKGKNTRCDLNLYFKSEYIKDQRLIEKKSSTDDYATV